MNGERGAPKGTPTPVSPPSSTEAQSTPDLLAHALAYAERGWPVLPLHSWTGSRCSCGRDDCTSPAKHPRTAHGLKDATGAPAIIRGWWRRWRMANIGLATGFAFDVLDMDGLAGAASLVSLLAEHGQLPVLPTVLTPRDGGMHLYLLPTGLGNSAGKLAPGLDYRGVGGYVVAPPSVHANGGTYAWLTASPAEVSTPAPAWLVARLSPPAALTMPPVAPTASPGATGRPGGTVVPAGDRKAAYGRRALESEALAVALAVEGTRNHTLNTAALKLGQVVAGGYLDTAEVVATLLAAAERAGLERREAEATIASGMAAGMAQPRRLAS